MRKIKRGPNAGYKPLSTKAPPLEVKADDRAVFRGVFMAIIPVKKLYNNTF